MYKNQVVFTEQITTSFQKASDIIEKFTGIRVSKSLMHAVTKEIGEKVFREDVKRAKEYYKKLEKASHELLERYRGKGDLYIFTYGPQINTISKDENGSTWREMKLGFVFYDGNSIRRKDGKMIVTNLKITVEYVVF